MLAFNHPDITALLLAFPGGLAPIRPDGQLSLAMKLSKESLLAIKENGGFSVYVVPYTTQNGPAFGLVSAFFDDADEPLVVRTPLFDGERDTADLISLITSSEIDIYFVDELGREWMSYRCTVEDPHDQLSSTTMSCLPPHSRENAIAILEWLQTWFGYRNSDDDERAIRIKLAEPLWPDDIAILDMREGRHDYIGSDGYSISMLERDAQRPGYYQERDIGEGLRRFLSADQIILNPMKRGTDKEFVDVVAATGSTVILIQAKDSPNTAKSLARTIERKLLVSEKQVADALTQIKGALRYAGSGDTIALSVGGDDLDLHLASRRVTSLAIVKEIFPKQAGTIRELMRDAGEAGQPLLIIDFPAFAAFIHFAPDEDLFVRELEAYRLAVIDGSATQSPRAFLVERFLDGTIVADALRESPPT